MKLHFHKMEFLMYPLDNSVVLTQSVNFLLKWNLISLEVTDIFSSPSATFYFLYFSSDDTFLY